MALSESGRAHGGSCGWPPRGKVARLARSAATCFMRPRLSRGGNRRLNHVHYRPDIVQPRNGTEATIAT